MSERVRYPRKLCRIPHCPSWSTLYQGEFMCARHFRLVDTALKRFRTRRLGALNAEFDQATADLQIAQDAFRSGAGRELEVWRRLGRLERVSTRWDRSMGLIWRRMKRQATERSVGLA